MDFKLITNFTPTGDQPDAIESLIRGVENNEKHQTLLGVTGSGKTFTVANVIQRLNKPTLVLAHNKTLAAQLYSEFKSFFPKNLVEYFVSYYDYYQPEAYIPTTGIYIEKDLSINEEIEKLRLSATSALLSGRNDIIIVASVSCIYGMGNPQEFKDNTIEISENSNYSRTELLNKLVQSLYSRSISDEFKQGKFRIIGDTIERVEIMQGLRENKFDVLIGVNLLREGLDLPEVSLVAILDADKEGFLRSHRSLTQTIGRAARHVNGMAILYADKITKSIKKTIDETNYRRNKQVKYNKKNGIEPKPIVKSIDNALTKRLLKNNFEETSEDIIDFKIPTKNKDFDKKIRELRKEMEKSAKELDFKSAALYRDQIKKMKELKSSNI